MPKSRKRKKAKHDRRNRPTRGNPAAAAAEADQQSLADYVLETLDHFEVQARNETPFGAEMILSAYLGAAWAVADLDRLKAVTASIGEMLGAVPPDHPASEAFVRTLAELGPPEARELTDAKLASLAPVIPGLPRQWVDAINRVELIDGLCATNGYNEHRDVLLQFGYPQPDGSHTDVHTISAQLDLNQYIVTDLILTLDDEALTTARQLIGTDDIVEVPFDAQQVSNDLHFLLQLTDLGPDTGSSDLAFLARFLLQGRLRALPSPRPYDRVDPADAWPPEACAALVETFIESPAAREIFSPETAVDGEPVPRDVARSIAQTCVSYSVTSGNGDPLRWSPANVDLFLLEYVPRLRPSWHADAVLYLPEVLAAWVTFAGRRDGKTESQIAETIDAIEEDIEDHQDLMRGRSLSVAEQTEVVAAVMRSDGVDLDDPEQVDRWFRDEN